MEQWDLFDANRMPLNKMHIRGKAIQNGEYHLVVEIWTINSKGEILLTLRDPNKDVYPDYWENTGGSALAGETSLEAAVRELEEETGIIAEACELELVDTVIAKSAFHDMYVLKKDWSLSKIRLQEGETTDAQWVSFKKMDQLIREGLLAPPIARRFITYRARFQSMLNQILNESLEQIILSNEVIKTALYRMKTSGLTQYYIGAGCAAQTVWNYITEQPLTQGIKDIDIVYYDNSDTSEEAELKMVEKIQNMLSDLDIKIDVKNQARVHLWYASKFGYDILPYTSVESAIDTWPTTATALGLRLNLQGKFEIYAPYGLEDLFAMRIKPNKKQITESIYLAKVNAWINKWPELEVISWEEA